jgi:DNA-binding response OmpR family regulator
VTSAPLHILLIEGDPAHARHLGEGIEQTGIPARVHWASDGAQALSYLSARDPATPGTSGPCPSLVLLDLRLPQQAGMDILGWMRQRPELRKVPVVVLSPSRETLDLPRAYELGAHTYLVKPVPVDELAPLLKAVAAYWSNLQNPPSQA